MTENLYELVAIISQIVDFEESSATGGRVQVKNGVSADLDELKHIYNGLGDFLVSS